MFYSLLGGGRDLRLAGEQLVKAYRSMRTIRKLAERMHKEFTTGQIRGPAHYRPSRHRGHGHSNGKGAES